MEVKFKFYLMALLVSVSMIFVACDKDKNDDVTNGAFAAEVAGTYEGTMKSEIMGTSDESPVQIIVEKAGDNTVNISYIELDEDEADAPKDGENGDEADAPKDGENGDEADAPKDGENGDEADAPKDGENGDEEEDDLISKIENVVVKKQGDAYLFVEQKGEQNTELGKITYTLNGGVKNKTITLILVTKNEIIGTATVNFMGTLKETK